MDKREKLIENHDFMLHRWEKKRLKVHAFVDWEKECVCVYRMKGLLLSILIISAHIDQFTSKSNPLTFEWTSTFTNHGAV
jgi:hypothetical protein